MGKGDRKTAKGKRYNSSYGNARSKATTKSAGGEEGRGEDRQQGAGEEGRREEGRRLSEAPDMPAHDPTKAPRCGAFRVVGHPSRGRRRPRLSERPDAETDRRPMSTT